MLFPICHAPFFLCYYPNEISTCRGIFYLQLYYNQEIRCVQELIPRGDLASPPLLPKIDVISFFFFTLLSYACFFSAYFISNVSSYKDIS
jgi:hypothetical protein